MVVSVYTYNGKVWTQTDQSAMLVYDDKLWIYKPRLPVKLVRVTACEQTTTVWS